MKNYIIYLTLLIITSCCEVNNNVNLINKYSIKETDSTFSLPIDSKTRTRTFSLHYFEDTTGIEYISLENEEYNSKYGVFHYYRLDSLKLSHTLKLNYEGPNAIIPTTAGNTTFGINEVIVASDFQNVIYKVNSNGDILHTYYLYNDNFGEDNYEGGMLQSTQYNPLYYKNGKYYHGLELPSCEKFSDDGHIIEFDKYPLFLIIDTATGELECSKIHFPKLYDAVKGIGRLNYFSQINDGKNFVFSFFGLDSIYVSDDLINLKAYPAKSKYINIKKNPIISLTQGDPIERTMFFHAQARYGNIIYDKYRNVYYRFCHLYDKKIIEENDFSKHLNDNYLFCHGEFSIQIIDSEFNVVGETLFPRGKYVPMYFFVNKEGLWMSENNYERTDISDDWLVFRCFNLVENEE